MHCLMVQVLPAFALLGMWGSASDPRPMATKSAVPMASRVSAISGSLTRLERMTGMFTTCLMRAQRSMLTACGVNMGAMTWSVGLLAYMPFEQLMASKPTSSRWRHSCRVSAMVRPPGTRSSLETRTMMGKSSPTRSRIETMISSTMRTRFAKQPPYWSTRRLMAGERNSASK